MVRRLHQSAFTLVELLIVLAIVAVLVVVLAMVVMGAFKQSGDGVTKTFFADLDRAIVGWREMTGKPSDVFPDSGPNSIEPDQRYAGNMRLYQALVAGPVRRGEKSLIVDPERYVKYLDADGSAKDTGDASRAVFVDGHGTPIVYWEWASHTAGGSSEGMKIAKNRGSYDLYSAGKDKVFGTVDDLDAAGNEPSPNPFAQAGTP